MDQRHRPMTFTIEIVFAINLGLASSFSNDDERARNQHQSGRLCIAFFCKFSFLFNFVFFFSLTPCRLFFRALSIARAKFVYAFLFLLCMPLMLSLEQYQNVTNKMSCIIKFDAIHHVCQHNHVHESNFKRVFRILSLWLGLDGLVLCARESWFRFSFACILLNPHFEMNVSTAKM